MTESADQQRVLEDAVQAIVDRLNVAHETQAPQTAVQDAYNQLQTIIASAESTAAEVFEAHMAAGQLLISHSHESNVDQLNGAAYHLRTAQTLLPDYRTKDSTAQIGPVLFSILGCVLTKTSEQASHASRPALAREAEEALRKAVNQSSADDPALVGRLSNLATHLLRHSTGARTEAAAQEAIDLIQRAISKASDHRDAPARATLWTNLGHARGYLADALHESHHDNAPAFVALAEHAYHEAQQIAIVAGLDDPITLSDQAFHQARTYKILGDEAQLDDAIELGHRSLIAMRSDDLHRPEAEMQLAEHTHIRFKLAGYEQDLRDAADLSEAAVESPYLERDGARRHELKWRRIEILRTAEGASGDWGSERHDLRRLLDEAVVTEGMAINTELRFIRAADDLEQARKKLPDASAQADAVESADELRALATTEHFTSNRLLWCTRWAQAELRLAESIAFNAGQHKELDTSRVTEAAKDLHALLTEDSTPDLVTRFYAMVTTASLLAHAGARNGDRDLMNRAAGTATAATRLEAIGDIGIPASNLIESARLAQRLHHYAGNVDGSQEASRHLAERANVIPPALTKQDLLLASSRLRRSIAGDAAAGIDDPKTAVWTQIALAAGQDIQDHETRNRVLAEITRRSASSTQIFLAIGYLDAHAVVVTDGSWQTIELPDLAADLVGADITSAYRAHQAAENGGRQEKDYWTKTRESLVADLTRLVEPLTADITKAIRVEIHLTGFAHALPLIPVLAAATNYTTPIVAVLTTVEREGSTSDPKPPGSIDVGIIAAPGVQGNYLATALDDAEYVADLFPDLTTQMPIEPSNSEATNLLTQSRISILIGHATGSHSNPADSSFLLTQGCITVRDIVGLDLTCSELAIFAACESLSPDAQLHENPLSLATAALFAGARAAIGAHWRVTDAPASTFTRLLFDRIAAGDLTEVAYLHALRATDGTSALFSLYVTRPFQRP